MDSPRHTRTNVLGADSDGTDSRDGRAGETARAGDPGDGGRDLRTVLGRLVVTGDRDAVSPAEVARAAGRTDRFVPELLDALADDVTAVRVGAAWTLCALADDQPGAVEYLATELADRVDDGPFEVGQVFSYLRGRYPGRVADAVDADHLAGDAHGSDPSLDDDASDCGGADDGADGRRDRPVRADADGKRVETDGGVPTTAATDPGTDRQVVSTDGTSRPVSPDAPATDTDSLGRRPPTDPPDRQQPADPPADHPTHPEYESSGRSTDRPGSPATDQRTPTTDRPTTPHSTSDERPETFAAIGSLSRCDRLSAVDRGVEERYATGYRCRAVHEDEEFGAAVRLFDRPDESDRLAFQEHLEDALARWEALGDIEGVVGVAEWGRRPRPWVRTDPVDASLAERGPPDVATALDQAADLAETVAAVHARSAVHGGLDPKSVVYPSTFEALESPRLDNVGLMGVFRQFFEPAEYLDPRFAAPEYYDDDFGCVDATTDVYGLGATCYYLLTGQPPFDGSYGEVRRGILQTRPTPASEAGDGIPPRVDSVLGRALAKEKLKRYDGVEPFLRALDGVRPG